MSQKLTNVFFPSQSYVAALFDWLPGSVSNVSYGSVSDVSDGSVNIASNGCVSNAK